MEELTRFSATLNHRHYGEGAYEHQKQQPGKAPIIRVVGKYALSKQAEAFVDRVTAVLRDVDIEFEFVLRQG